MFRNIDRGAQGICMINRCVLTVKVKQPFLDWLHALPDPPRPITLARANQDTAAYLLPVYEYDDDKERILETYYDLVFEELLMGWWTDRAGWPSARDLRTFKKWFDVEFHSIAFDLVDAPLLHDD